MPPGEGISVRNLPPAAPDGAAESAEEDDAPPLEEEARALVRQAIFVSLGPASKIGTPPTPSTVTVA